MGIGTGSGCGSEMGRRYERGNILYYPWYSFGSLEHVQGFQLHDT